MIGFTFSLSTFSLSFLRNCCIMITEGNWFLIYLELLTESSLALYPLMSPEEIQADLINIYR